MGALLSRPLPFIIIRRLLSWRCCCDHCLSSSSWRQNYLYLAHSKLRNCSFGPVRHREDTACACCDTAFHRRPLPFTAFRRGSAHCRSCWWRTSPAACREPPGSGAARPPAFSPSFAVALLLRSPPFRHFSPPCVVALLLRSLPFVIFHRLLSWHCCGDHRLSSSFTALCRGTAVAITAVHRLSPPCVVALLLRSLPPATHTCYSKRAGMQRGRSSMRLCVCLRL